ncbi:MAG: AAA family ATPase [Lachnospiraceae bacterium]
MNSKSVFAYLDPEQIPALVGEDPKRRLAQCLKILDNTAWPLYLVGPSGSGKTLMSMNLAKEYSAKYSVPAYYVQLSPEMTKTSLILGLRLVEGSLTVVDGVIADCMKNGGIIVIDEAAHTTHEMLLMLNSILDRTSVTSVGDRIIYSADTFRVIFCSNDSSYAGNVRLPQSFAQRLVALDFDYPGFESEVAITAQIAEDECEIPLTVPVSVIKYIVATIREMRSTQYPLSARNAAIITVILNLSGKHNASMLADYFTDKDTSEAKRRAAASRIFQKSNEILTMEDLLSEQVSEFQLFVSSVGVDTFRSAFLSGSMYYLDVDGLELNQNTVRNTIANSII